MSSTTSVSRVARRTAPLVLFATVLWPVVAFGGVYSWGYGPLIALCGLFAVIAFLGEGWRVDALLTGCIAAVTVAVALQLVGVTPSVLRTASPAALTLLERQDVGYALGSATGSVRHSLSINPEATWRFLEIFLALAALFAGVTSLAATMPFRIVATTTIGIGAVLALVGIAQARAGSIRMYGIWSPQIHAAVFGPFVNRNHFAAWMLMVCPLAMTQCAAHIIALRRDRGERATVVETLGSSRAGRLALTAFAGVLITTALLMTGSRAAIAAFLMTTAAIVWVAVRHRTSARAAVPVAVGILALAGIAVTLTGWRPIVARFDELPGTRLSGRLDAWKEAGRIARDFWLTGSGLNTYATATPVYHDPAVKFSFSTPHNDYLQAASDGGLLVGLPLAATLGVLVVRIWRELRDPAENPSSEAWTRCGAVLGLLAVALQELVDFGLQTPANAVMFVVLAAYAAARPHHRSRPLPKATVSPLTAGAG
jgi:O-antigen ligase